MKYDFAVIGLGKVGGAMASLLRQAGHSPLWAVSSKSDRSDFPRYSDIPQDPQGIKILFLAVPDSAVAKTAEHIAGKWKDLCKGIVIYHFSGLYTSELLTPLAGYGAEVGSLHPLQSIKEESLAQESIREAYFVFEGSGKAQDVAEDLISSLDSRIIPISKQDKVIYHTAAAIASNYLVAITAQASELMETIGLELNHLIPLISSTLRNLKAYGHAALTGPIQRGDWKTVEAHLTALTKDFPDILPSYRELGKYTAKIALRSWPEQLNSEQKLLGLTDLKSRVAAMKKRGMKVVFTNGCFDILHEGHVSYLKQAKGLGDALVLGLNSDSSVKRLKGSERPINNEFSRAAVLSALSCIDYICIFNEDTPYELIAELQPQVLVKGGDWEPDRIVGADIVKSYGGEVLSLAFKPGHSTTGIIEKIRTL